MATQNNLRDFDSLYELLEFFNTEEKCVDYLAQMRWNGEPQCPYCGVEKCYTLNVKGRGKMFMCSGCRKNFSVRVGTIFEESKIPLRKWFVAVYLITAHKKGISSHQLAKDIKVTQKTAWYVLHRVREAFCPKDEMLSNEVEIDESFFGGKEKNKSKSIRKENKQFGMPDQKIPVLGIIERNGKVFAMPVKDTKRDTLVPIIESKVVKNSKVYTDEHKSYKKLKDNYEHSFVRHSANIYVSGDVHTNNIESFWALLKRGILGIYHHTSEKHLHRYINEFTFRFNNRKLTDGSRFDVLLANASKTLSYNELIKIV